MRQCNWGKGNWRPWLCAAVAGVFACSLAVYAAPPGHQSESQMLNNAGALIQSGEKIPVYRIPRVPAVEAMKADTVLSAEGHKLLLSIAGDEGIGGTATPSTGGPAGCELDAECDDCNPCTTDECVLEVCQSTLVTSCTVCSDGIFCNGDERCDVTGLCLDADDPDIKAPSPDRCISDPTLICDETPLAHIASTPGCVVACEVDGDCNDANSCSGVEFCTAKVCLGGADDGEGCADGTTCDSGLCGGVCRTSGNPCGAGSPCQPSGEGFTCGWGRCCTAAGGGEYACTRTKLADCAGRWLGVGDSAATIGEDDATCTTIWGPSEPNPGEYFECPKYESGLVDGNIIGTLGPAGVSDCHPFSEIGDDYALSNAGPDEYYELRTLRWIGGFDQGTGSRMRFRFYTTTNVLVADIITNFSFASGIVQRTVVFGAGEAIIPATGYITVGPAVEFSPTNLTRWGVTDAAGFVGTNSNTNVVVRVGNGPLTVTNAGSLGLPGGVLAFELVGDKYMGEPLGACCNPETGECLPQLKHICENSNGFFQGVGTSCNVCFDNPFLSCNDNQDCIDGGALGPCVPAPPACLLNACCDPDTGECGLSDTGGTCCTTDTGPCVGSGSACFNDTNCPVGEICRPNCPGRCAVGNFNEGEFCNANNECDQVSENDGLGTCTPDLTLVPQGFGTACEPNCCISPTLANKDLSGPFPDTGTPGDDCVEAGQNVLVINVPPVGDVATYTISGNNKNATFGDFATSCPAGIFDPNGGTRDRGYFIAFSIDACADVRIDMCCTNELSGEIHQPQWAFLYSECNPCGTVIGNTITGALTNPPIGQNDDASNRGAPFCNSDDLWQTFRGLQAGTYWHPIYTATGGHFGQFQVHITLTACPLAACCIPGDADNNGSCLGGSEPGSLCDRDSDCAGGGTCVQGCQVLNQYDCNAVNGYWHGFGNVPSDQSPVVTCSTPYQCIGLVCNNGPNVGQACVNDSDCGPPNICDFGSCCTGGGQCIDATGVDPCDPSNPASCYDLDLCGIDGGNYRGGARCDYPLNPCPACEIQGEGNCQIPDLFNDFGFANLSDLAVPPHGVAVADDFIPAGTTISSLCVWGVYLDESVGDPNPNACAGVVADKFRVRIYEDIDHDADPLTANQPGTLVAERTVSGASVAKTYIPLTALEQGVTSSLYQVYGYTLQFSTIVLPDANKVYWLEVANNTTHLAGDDVNDPAQATPNTCWWHWLQTFHVDGVGNNYSHTGTDDRPITQKACRGGTAVGLPCDVDGDCPGAGATCVAGGNGYFGDMRSGRGTDFAFCIADINGPVAFTAPAEPLGVCCLCDGTNELGRSLDDCRDGIADGDTALDGTWHISNNPLECVPQLGDNCGAAGAVAAGLDCTEVQPPGGAIQISDGFIAYDSSCAENSAAAQLSSGNFLVEDVWMEYTASCTGRLFISSCAAGNYYGGFDSYLAVYHDAANPMTCPCPSSTAGLIADEDESCNGVADGGAGYAGPIIVTPGQCYMIRAGGWDNAITGSTTSHGGASVDVQCFEALCTPSAPPVQERLVVGLSDFANQKVRHLAVRTDLADAGKSQALRVKIIDLPAGHEINEGITMYVGSPRRVCENAGQSTLPAPGSPPNYGCGPAGGGPRTTWIASLQTDPFYMDWHGRCDAGTCVGGFKPGEVCAVNADCAGAVNVYHSVIAPSRFAASPATFEVSVVADDCVITDATSFSDPLVMTAAKWGDVLLDNSTMPPRPSNNITEISDVVGILNKFKNLAGAIGKARADIEPACVDHLVQISDVTNALDAFASDPFPFPPGNSASTCP